MADALANLKPGEGAGDLFVKIKEGHPVKLRVLTTDPYMHKDNYGNTRIAFSVWSHDENRPMILDKGWSIARPIQELHLNEDWGADITKMDIKISAKGTGKETEYTVTPMPKPIKLEDGHIEEVNSLNLDKIIKNGIYASQNNEGKEIPENPKAVEQEDAGDTPAPKAEPEDVVIEDIGDEPINLDDIPF